SILLPFPSPFKNHHDTIRQNISICLNNEKISFILSICELIWKYVKVWSHCSFPINKRLCSTLYKAAFIRASKVTYHIKINKYKMNKIIPLKIIFRLTSEVRFKV